jgi:hypothetical protein
VRRGTAIGNRRRDCWPSTEDNRRPPDDGSRRPRHIVKGAARAGKIGVKVFPTWGAVLELLKTLSGEFQHERASRRLARPDRRLSFAARRGAAATGRR